MSELISIIMPAYNAEKYISYSIRSVLAQTYHNWELIIIDDCSTDNTVAIINAFLYDSRIQLLTNKVNQGVAVTRKKGFASSNGKWIAFLDSDDLWDKYKLEKQYHAHTTKRVDFIFTGSGFIDSDGMPIDWYLHVPQSITYKQLLKQNLISNSSVFISRDLYLQHLAFADNFHEDFACWLKVLKEGYSVLGIDEPLLIYRLSQYSKSGNKKQSARMNWNTYRYCGLSIIQSLYYMGWYMVNGLLKYSRIKKAMKSK